jgi:LPXTG-motif cell wall-anchored protein
MKTENNILLALLGIGALIGISALIKRNRKKKEGFSEFLGGTQGKVAQFILTNNTNSVQKLNLFDSWGGFNNPNVGINPSMGFFNRSLSSDPKFVNYFMISANTAQTTSPDGTVQTPPPSQATKPIMKICKDASGNASTEVYYPMVSAFQVRGEMTVVQPNNLFLDGTCFLQYELNPKTTVNFTINYISKSDLDKIKAEQEKKLKEQKEAEKQLSKKKK